MILGLIAGANGFAAHEPRKGGPRRPALALLRWRWGMVKSAVTMALQVVLIVVFFVALMILVARVAGAA